MVACARDNSDMCFNPCFCGTRSRTDALGACDGFQGHVSILVFVELALGHQGPAQEPARWRFQSLFLWNSLSDVVGISFMYFR